MVKAFFASLGCGGVIVVGLIALLPLYLIALFTQHEIVAWTHHDFPLFIAALITLLTGGSDLGVDIISFIIRHL